MRWWPRRVRALLAESTERESPASIAGCAQANISARRRSGISASAGPEPSTSATCCNCFGRNLAGLAPSREVDPFSARHGQQPRFGICRTTIPRPIRQRRGECFRQRIFGRGHIARACREKCDELAVTAASHRVCCPSHLFIVLIQTHDFTELQNFAWRWRSSEGGTLLSHADPPRALAPDNPSLTAAYRESLALPRLRDLLLGNAPPRRPPPPDRARR